MKKYLKLIFTVVVAVILMSFFMPERENVMVSGEKMRILIDAGHGGKYLRQKNKKDLCGRTGLKKYANKPKIKYIHKLNDSVSLAILFDLRMICPKSGTCTDKLWIMLPQTG